MNAAQGNVLAMEHPATYSCGMGNELDRDNSRRTSRRAFFAAGGSGLAMTLALRPAGVWAAWQMAPGREALEFAERRRGELISLLSALVAVRSHTGESAAQAQGVVTQYLAALPYRVEVTEDAPSRLQEHPEFMPPSPPGEGPFVNVVAHPADGAGTRFGVFSHIDTEVPGEGWGTDPYQVTRVNRRLHGVGTADDKGGVAAMLVAAAALHEIGSPLPTVMSLHGKGGGSRGSLPVFERFARAGTNFGAVLYSHPAETGRGLVDIKNVVQGALDLTLEVTGWRGAALEIGSPESALFDTGGDALHACWGAIEHLRATALAGLRVNVGELESGDRVGAVPESARARIRVLFDSPHTWRDLLAEARRQLDVYVRGIPQPDDTYDAVLTQDGLATNPGAVDWDGSSCEELRAAIEEVTGTAPRPYRNHYAGDIRYPIRLLGAPAFGIGSLGGNFYGPNEWVDADDLVNLTAVIIATVRRWSMA